MLVSCQGTLSSQSMWVWTTLYSALASLIRLRRSISASHSLRAGSGNLAASMRSFSFSMAASVPSTSPSSERMALSCWRRKYSRWDFSIATWVRICTSRSTARRAISSSISLITCLRRFLQSSSHRISAFTFTGSDM